jgi:hypothetical protein
MSAPEAQICWERAESLCSASGDTAEGISSIEDRIRDYVASGAILAMPFSLALKAKALHLADRTSKALEALKEAEALGRRRFRRSILRRERDCFLRPPGKMH